MKTSKRILAAAILICICMPMAFSYFRATAFRQIRESTNCFDSTDIRERQLGIINVDDTGNKGICTRTTRGRKMWI